MKIKELIPNDEIINIGKYAETDIQNCTSDFRRADKGSLLFLLPGVSFNTYELIPEFLKSSPCAIVTEKISEFPKTRVPLIEVKNARRAFAFAMSALSKINYKELKFIGVTGTNGKTSTATMIYRILNLNGYRCGFIGTGKIEFCNKRYTDENYSMTCPDPDLLYPTLHTMQDDGCNVIVMEVSSHALELEKTAPISFDIGIFTGFSHEHIDFHGSMEAYFSAKEKLIKSAKRAIINFDDDGGKRLYDRYREKSTGVGVVWKSDVSATDVENYGLCGIGYIFRGKNFLTRVKLPLPGLYNIYNSMLAFEAAIEMNVTPKGIKEALESTDFIEGRCECIYDDITVIVDYAHTPRALENILKTSIYDKNPQQKITLVFGCGGERDCEKRPMMAAIAEKYADKIIVTNDNPRGEDEEKIISDITSGFRKARYGVIRDRSVAITYAIKSASPSDIVIIAGKGHEKYIYDKNGYRPFDEKEIIRSALKLRRSEVWNEN
ncbi:MAG: UDP-N-acetylmuramoyl-L-alanyl-D-glutamate--2,6-diaminopimelate ligase [Ruminococcaceae bacterium]|nr:UDP-N-acetylmuramoyl-L-alanyl-D-glutamate--2,6-diaminopimelate ligase [Oscillospiraceae bacterium]